MGLPEIAASPKRSRALAEMGAAMAEVGKIPNDWSDAAIIYRARLLRYASDCLLVVADAVVPRPVTAADVNYADAERYAWLRADNAQEPEAHDIKGGPALDRLCDEGIRKMRGNIN